MYVDWKRICIYICVQCGHNASLTTFGVVLADRLQFVLNAFQVHLQSDPKKYILMLEGGLGLTSRGNNEQIKQWLVAGSLLHCVDCKTCTHGKHILLSKTSLSSSSHWSHSGCKGHDISYWCFTKSCSPYVKVCYIRGLHKGNQRTWRDDLCFTYLHVWHPLWPEKMTLTVVTTLWCWRVWNYPLWLSQFTTYQFCLTTWLCSSV